MTPTFERQSLPLPNGESKVLLHSCCAPCSGEVKEAMIRDFTVHWWRRSLGDER